MSRIKKENERHNDRRNHKVRHAIEELYNHIYIPNFNNTIGIETIRKKYIKGCPEDVLLEITLLAISDGKSKPPLKRKLRGFALLLIERKIVILNNELSKEDIDASGF